MSTAHKLDPVTLLREIESRSRHHAVGLPMQVEVRRSWTGVAFRVDTVRFVAPLDKVNEILIIPDLTKVPGAQAWVRGISNVRGTLMPILDLKTLLDGGATKSERHTRMLVIRNEGMVAGLMVDEVYGMRHFFDEDRVAEMPNIPEFVKDYVRGAYVQGEVAWGLFNVDRITASKAFQQVAARSA